MACSSQGREDPMRVVRRATRLIGCLAVCTAMAGWMSGTAGAATDDQTPKTAKLAVVGSGPIDVHISTDGATDQGHINVLVTNSGGAKTAITPAAVLGNRAVGRICNTDKVKTQLLADSPKEVAAHSTQEFAVGVTLPTGCIGSAG